MIKECRCGTRKYWRVLHRKHNHTYFHRPQGQPCKSDYSTVICLKCPLQFRTKAKYVDSLKDFSHREVRNIVGMKG